MTATFDHDTVTRFATLDLGGEDPARRLARVKADALRGERAESGIVTREYRDLETRGTDRINFPAPAGVGSTASERPAARARRLYGLDFRVALAPVQYQARGADGELGPLTRSDKSRVVYRRDTGAALGVVGSRYVPIQPDALDIIDDVLGDYTVDRGGWWDNGGTVWLQTNATTIPTPAGPAERRVLVANPLDGSGAFTIADSLEVVACRNVYRSILRRGARMKVRHTASGAERLSRIRAAFRGSEERAEGARRWLFSAATRRVTERELFELARELFPADTTTLDADATLTKGWASTRTANQVERFVEAYRAAPGAQPGNAFGLMQAATWWASHGRDARSSDAHAFGGAVAGWSPSAWASAWTPAAQQVEDKAYVYVRQLVGA